MALEVKDGYVVDTTPAVAPDVVISSLEELLSTLPGYSTLTHGMKNAALQGALMPDENGVWPGKTGYIETYDIYFAALSLLGFLRAQPVIRSTSSEGTSVSVDSPDWSSVAAYYTSQSRILAGRSQDVLREVAVPGLPHVKRTDMSGRGDHYGDVDTDLG